MPLLWACQKKVSPIDSFSVTVEYKQTSPKDLVANVELNPKDSIYLNFTISSPTDMTFIEIQRNGVRIDTFRLNNGRDTKTFSAIKGYMVDSAAGEYAYRVLARDEKGVFMGDGGKQLKVTVKPDFDFWSYRILQVPDTVAKTNKCYYSTKDGKTYSYSEGAAVSASIDFGYFFDSTGRASTATTDDSTNCIYALNTAPSRLVPISFYDISGWTKNATLLKKMPNSVNFVTGLTSAGAIQRLIGGNMTSGTSSKVTFLSASAGSVTSAVNNLIGFRRADGKFGAILIRYVQGNSPNKETQIEVDVKVQK